MRTIFSEYNPRRNTIDVYTSAGYMLRIDCQEAEKNLKTTPGSDCALNALAIDEPLFSFRHESCYVLKHIAKSLPLRYQVFPPYTACWIQA